MKKVILIKGIYIFVIKINQHFLNKGSISFSVFQFVSQLPQYVLPEQTWAVIKDIAGGVKDSLPTEELRELISAVEAYVEKVHVHISENMA